MKLMILPALLLVAMAGKCIAEDEPDEGELLTPGKQGFHRWGRVELFLGA